MLLGGYSVQYFLAGYVNLKNNQLASETRQSEMTDPRSL